MCGCILSWKNKHQNSKTGYLQKWHASCVFILCVCFYEFPTFIFNVVLFLSLKKKLFFKVLILSLIRPDRLQKLRPLSCQGTLRFWGEAWWRSKSCPRGSLPSPLFPLLRCHSSVPEDKPHCALAPASVTHLSLHLHLGILLASERQSEGRKHR